MKRFARIALAIALLLVLGLGGWSLWRSRRSQLPEGLLIANGRIEGRLTNLTPKVTGQVRELPVDEGKAVSEGDLLMQLEDAALEHRIQAGQRNVEALQNQARALQLRIETLALELPIRIAQAEAALSAARSRVRQAEAEANQARTEARRYVQLRDTNAASQQRAEDAELRATIADRAKEAAEATRVQTERELDLAKLGPRRLEERRAELTALQSRVEQARATHAALVSDRNELTVRSPIDGTVLARTVELGERVGPGTPLVTLVDLNKLYVKVFIPEVEIGRVVLGQEARVYVDSFPGRSFPARVSRVSQEAEFTPKNVETKRERVKLVFAVELTLEENPGAVLKPGMPVDAVIRWDDQAEWQP